MLVDVLFLVGGGVGVWLGAEGMVRGAVKLAAYLGVPSLIIGLTVVAFGTSAPELVVSSIAAVRGHSAIVLGNVLGSNIINVALVLGLSALVAPIAVSTEVLRRDIPVVVVVTFAVVVMAFLGDQVGRIDAAILLCIFIGHAIYSYKLAVREQQRRTTAPGWEQPKLEKMHIAFLIGGTIILAVGAEGMVRGAVGIAEAFGVSKRVIGLTIVAFGTSVPELAASVVAAKQKESDLAIGNIVGSNLYNMTLILGTASMIAPTPSKFEWPATEVIFFVVTVLMLIPLIRLGWRLGRIDGVILLSTYVLSLVFLFL
ncbi:MAG: calcium/sodium antiporter [Deltaproteobacteria bacterium]|nr:calcium/sodium antiporter [Deltaproteobacteria bacterium]